MRKKCCTSLMNSIIIALQHNLICFHMDSVPLEIPSELSILSINGRSFWETIKSAFNSVNYQSVIVCWCPYSARKLAWKLETVYSGDKCLSHFILSIWLLTTYPRFFIHLLGVICARQEYMDSNGSSSFCLKRGNRQNFIIMRCIWESAFCYSDPNKPLKLRFVLLKFLHQRKGPERVIRMEKRLQHCYWKHTRYKIAGR